MNRSGVDRVPHSFPTRRSSDLTAPCMASGVGSQGTSMRSAHTSAFTVRLPTFGGQSIRKIGRDTSELQSRGHLVCRLLLEKKNNMTTYLAQSLSQFMT